MIFPLYFIYCEVYAKMGKKEKETRNEKHYAALLEKYYDNKKQEIHKDKNKEILSSKFSALVVLCNMKK